MVFIGSFTPYCSQVSYVTQLILVVWLDSEGICVLTFTRPAANYHSTKHELRWVDTSVCHSHIMPTLYGSPKL